MPYLVSTDKPIYWSAKAGANTYISDIAEVGGKIGIPPTVTAIYDTDENAYLGKMIGNGGIFQPLPSTGGLCEAGKIYSYNGGAVICRQTHNRTEHVPADIPALFSVYRPASTGPVDWIANEPVMIGMVRLYVEKQYKCLQAHTTQADWTPPATPALWQDVTPAPPGAWSYPVAYKIGNIVTYQGLTYKCLQAHTSQAGWTPPVVPALWNRQ